ncbi:MAG: hypothetical protein R2761_22060 [Acidimicrobiales bacterium]
MAVRFLDPRGSIGTPIEPYTLSADWSAGAPAIGLLANGFPDSVNFLTEIGEVLATELPGVRTVLWNKGDASSLASDDLLTTIVGEVQAVIAAYGH